MENEGQGGPGTKRFQSGWPCAGEKYGCRLWPGLPIMHSLPMHNVQAVCIGQTLPCEIIGHSRVLLLGLFLLVCLLPAADEECSGCTDEAQMHWRGPRTIYHSSHYRNNTFVTRRRKKDTMEKEREIRPQEGGSNGRKWL